MGSRTDIFQFKEAWVTLLTKPSYLPGAVILAHSLQMQASKYPLLIVTTPSFPSSMVPLLSRECDLTNSHLIPMDALSPPDRNKPDSLIASRFEDTWSKLRVFELYKYGFEKLIFLDADMLVLNNMDELFDLEIPHDWIAASHVCVCNLDNDEWAPGNWTTENCAFSGLSSDDPPAPVPNVATHPHGLQTHTILNGGLFIFSPFDSQWKEMIEFLNHDARVKEFIFPDQDFLAEYFKNRWMSLGWQYNALKTWKYWHPNLWEDNKVKNLHYIVDKPWSKRVGIDGIAGYLGKDGITHRWWWRQFQTWEQERESAGEGNILRMIRGQVAAPLTEEHLKSDTYGG